MMLTTTPTNGQDQTRPRRGRTIFVENTPDQAPHNDGSRNSSAQPGSQDDAIPTGWRPVDQVKAAGADADNAYQDTYEPYLQALKKTGFVPSLIPVNATDRVLIVVAGPHQIVVSDNGRPLPWDATNITQVAIADGNGQSTVLPGTATPEQVTQAVTNLVNSFVG